MEHFVNFQKTVSTGVQSVAYAFPKVNIVTTAVDKEINEDFHILPGIGNHTFYKFYSFMMLIKMILPNVFF